MTPIDRFERQLPAALTELAGPRTPDYLIDILGQTARTSQRSAWASIERWLPLRASTSVPAGGSTTRRLTLVAIVAALVLIVVAMVALSGGGPSPLPAVVAETSTDPSAAAIVSAAPSGPAPYASTRPLPAALIGGWVRPAGDDWSLVSSQVATIAFGELDGDTSSSDYLINRPDEPPVQGATVHEVAPGVIEINADEPTGSCLNGQAGRYAWSVTGDGQWMTLTPDGVDACATRGRILAGTWQRSLAHDNIGGPGIATSFQPFLEFTLPRQSWVGGGVSGDQVVLDSADGSKTFKVWRDLDGFADPCDITKGRANLAPGMDAFLGYLNGDPRFTVTNTEEFTIDGHRAVAVTFRLGDAITAPCWTLDGNEDDRTGVLLWVQRSWGSDGHWNQQIATDGLVVVTEVDGTALVFEAVDGTGGKVTLTRDILDTVRFVNELPTPPAS